MTGYERLLGRVRLVRRRWRLQKLARGAALFLASSAAMLVLGVWGADLFGFSRTAIWTARVLAAGSMLFAAVRFIYFPLRRRISDTEIAQFVEERFPELQDRLVSAVEFGVPLSGGSGLIDLLIRDALEKSSQIDFSVFTDPRKIAAYGVIAATSVLILVGLLTWGPYFFPYGFERLYVPWAQASSPERMAIQVNPGDLEIARGSDQQIEASLLGFDSPQVRLYTLPEGSAAWEEAVMEPRPQANSFLYLLVDVQRSLRYYIEAGGIRSEIHTLSILDRPLVQAIDLTYTFPPYTGMEPQTAENEGDIVALKGTKVELQIRLSSPAESGRLLFADGSEIQLSRTGEATLSGSFTIKESGSYVVWLTHPRAGTFVASREYTVEALDDEAPRISITKPLRDIRATNIEEVFTELKAEDDMGLGKLDLHFSVNGGPEKTVVLYGGRPKLSSVTEAHTFFLEEFALEPGDVISYYGSALDNNNLTGPGSSTSDMYFIQVRPFEQKYTQSQQGGAPGAGGEGQEALSRQQKDIIAATFRLIRDGEGMDAKEYEDSLKALALIQSRLQAQTQSVIDRMLRRGAADADENFARLAEYLRNAVAAMEKAAVDLGASKPKDALPQEQKALQQLMRAESTFREIQISFANQAGGGGSQSSAEDLADLFELELNKLKNQYETIQRGEQRARDQQLDEATQRLKELARRQQQLNERNLQLGQRAAGAPGQSGGSQGQQQLLDEAVRLQRQLQRLSRERSSPELDRVSSQLRQAIEQMRRALDRSNRGQGSEASAEGQRAAQRLEEAQRTLARAQDAGLSSGIDKSLEEARRLLNEQNKIAGSIDELSQRGQQSDAAENQSRLEGISERKSALADGLRGLAGELEDLSRQARGSQRESSARLSDAAGVIRDRRLPERVLSTKPLLQNGLYDFAKGREEFIRAGLEELNRQLEAAKNGLGQSKEGKLEEAYNRTRQLAEGLESMHRRLLDRARSRRQPGGARGDSTTPGKEAEKPTGDERLSPDQTGARGEDSRQNSSGDGASRSGRQGQGQSEQGEGSRPYDVRGMTNDAGGPPLGMGGHRDEDVRQLRREFQQRIADAEELRRLLDRNASQLQNLSQVINSLKRLRDGRDYGDPEEVARLRAAVDLLHQMELGLSRELGRLAGKGQFLHPGEGEVPRGFEKLVEEYYKALARMRPRQ